MKTVEIPLKMMPLLNDDFVVRQPSDVLVEVKYGGEEYIGEDNDGNEKKKVKCK